MIRPAAWPAALPGIVGLSLLMMAGCASQEAGEAISSAESTAASAVVASVDDSQPAPADSTDPSSAPTSSVSSTVGTSSTSSTTRSSTAPVGCPDDIVEVVESDIDGDGAVDRVYLRRAGTPTANLVGICSDTVSVPELDVGGTETSLAGVFDVDGDGDGEIFVSDTSARSLIYNAAALTAAGLEMTTVVLETTIDTETGEPFNAGGFQCVPESEGIELVSYRYMTSDDRVQVTSSAIGLDGLSMTETVIESYDADPSEALSIWNEPDRCFD